MIIEETFLAADDYYEVMGLTPEANQVEIEAAFRERSAGLNLRHPDPQERIQSAEKMLSLTAAYETLSDPIMRSRYDLQVLGRKNLPVQEKVDILFKEGIRAYRQRETDLALRYLKEVANLYPHRALYRVHLAIAYADKDWMAFTESELETALRLDPDFTFAKEIIAKVLFKLPDRRRHWYHSKLNQQVLALAGFFVLLGILIASGLPQRMAKQTYQKMASSVKAERKLDDNLENQLPADMREELEGKQKKQSKKTIPYFESNYKPEGKVFDYSQQEAQSKVFYPDQQMVVITYKDGSILTYRPAELKGWKKDAATGTPIMITSSNELIPSPNILNLTLPDNTPVDLQNPEYGWMFPEYEGSATSSDSAPAEEPPVKKQPAKTYNPYGS